MSTSQPAATVKPTIIHPTVGRKVHYWPSHSDLQGPKPMHITNGQPLDATVLAVWGDRCVNLLVVDISGETFPKLSATLVQEGDAKPHFGTEDAEGLRTPGGYAEWMPYQTGQAKAQGSAPQLGAGTLIGSVPEQAAKATSTDPA